MEKHFVILSSGAYSDYDPIYYMGDVPISQEEMDIKGREIGDSLITDFQALPTRTRVKEYSWQSDIETYDPNTNKGVYRPGFDTWFPSMEKWILEKGYKKLPENIPEINVSYSEIPTSFS